MKLSLCMVVKDGLADLKRLRPLVEPHIDEWVVVLPPGDKAIDWCEKKGIKTVVADFTQEIEPEILEQFGKYGIEIPKDYRLFNFAAARNAGLGAVIGDYMLWLDADDEPVGMEFIKPFIEKNPKSDLFNAIYDYARDEQGNRASDHIRERVIRNNGRFSWLGSKLGLIHETLLPETGYQPFVMDFPEDVFRVEHGSDHTNESSIRNHIALLYEYLKTDGADPRNTYYLGIEFFNRRMYDHCVSILTEFVKKSGSAEDRCHAWLKLAEAWQVQGKYAASRNAYFMAMDEMPHYPHAYLGIGETYFNERNWAKAIEYTMTGLQKKLPGTRHGLDKQRFTFRPAGYIALSYLEIGRPDLAYEWFAKAAAMNPKHPWVKEYAQLFNDAKNLDDYVRSFVRLGQLSQKLYPKTLSKLTEAVPDELMDQELLMDFKWRYSRPKVWPENSVVFFCSHAFEDWGPESLKNGCGGSEEAVIQLTKRLADMGWDITVYNNCIKEGTVDSVKWVRFERFNPRDVFNIVVSWRNNLFDNSIVANRKFIDMHDIPNKPPEAFYRKDDMKDVKFLVKSQYHRSLFMHLPDENFMIIPNGIDLKQFEKPKKSKNNLVWTSSYDRGLESLLKIWPEVRKKVPDATLDVYYGFALYDATPWGAKPAGQAWKHKMIELLKQDGVTDHGRVGAEIVAEAYKKADVWAYPTRFPEISCITAMKAQAAGAVPVTTDFAALKETVKGGVIVEGDINEPEVLDKFRDELIALLKDNARKEKLRGKLDVSEYDWGIISMAWDKEFRR